MSNETTKPKVFITSKDIAYILTIGAMIVTFFVRFALLETKVEQHEDKFKIYEPAVMSNDIKNIKDDIAEIKQLLKDM